MTNQEDDMRILAVLLVALAFVAAGCGGGGGSAEQAKGSGTAATEAQSKFDRAFIDAMVPHHLSAIDMAREAKQAGLTQPALIKIANDIIAGQQKEVGRLLNWRLQWFGSRDREPEEAAMKTLGVSAEEAGMAIDMSMMDMSMAADVDQAFAEMMINHHQGAIRMARLAQQKAGRAQLKELADGIIAAQQREIGVMRKYA
jgi:uncharacterized protein (DUF305 family)